MDYFSKALDTISSKSNKQFFEDLFKTMPSAIAETCITCNGQKTKYLIRTGDACNMVYVLLKGKVRVCFELPNGINYTIAIFNAPSFLGETETFSGFPCFRASVIFETDCTYIAIPRAQFIKWMKTSSDALFTITTSITRKIAKQATRDRTFLFSSGESRLAYQFTQYYEISSKNDICKLNIQRSQLADEICLSVKTVNRCISKLKENNLICQKGRTITITKAQYERLLDFVSDT